MIEYKIIGDPYLRKKFGLGWNTFPKEFEATNIDFKLAKMRIDGVEYTDYTNDYIDAFKKAKTWQMLSA